MRRAIAGFALLALAAGAASAASSWRLSPYGLGPLEVGMTADQAARTVGLRRAPPRGVGGDESCWEFQAGPPFSGLWMMVQHGRVVRVSLGKGSDFHTERGTAVGDREQRVRAAYGAGLRAQPNAYASPPGHYLTWVVPDRSYAIKFSTDARGTVTEIDAGRPGPVAAPEGCQ